MTIQLPRQMRELKKAILRASFFYFLFVPMLSKAQSGIQYWNTDNGLSNNWVSDILQDRDGYIWIATQYGLNRFDGYSFTHIKYEPNNENSLQANWVRTMSQDESGNIWLGTFYGGICKLDPKKGTVQRYELNKADQLSARTILDMYSDSEQSLWIGCTDGLYYKTSESNNFVKLLDIRVETITPGKDGNMFLLSNGKVLYAKKNKLEIDTIWNTIDVPIKQIVSEGDDTFWAVSDQQLLRFEYNEGDWSYENLFQKSEVNFNQFYQPLLKFDENRHLWVGVPDGIIKYDPTNGSNMFFGLSEFYPKPVKAGPILSMIHDNQGNQWLGTTEGLLLHAKYTKRFEIDRKYRSIQSIQNVRELIQIQNKFFLGNAEGLFVFDLNKPGQGKQKIMNSSVVSLFQNNSNELLVGGNNLHLVQLNNLSIKTIPGTTNVNSIWSMVKDRGGKLWISTIKGLFRLDLNTNHVDHYTSDNVPSLISNINQALCIDREGRLWASSLESGLYMLEAPHQIKNKDIPNFIQIQHINGNENSLTSQILTSVVEDHDGFIWVGTDGGLNKIDPNKSTVRQYLNKDGLLDEKIMSLILDDQGFLWGSTAGHGIFRFNIKTNSFSFFNQKDGLVNNNFLLSAAFKNKEGHLFFGSNDMTQIIDPLKANSFSQPNTSFFFTNIHLADKDQSSIAIDSKRHVDLTHSQSVFSVHFTSLNYFQASETEYYYRIKDVQDDWQSNNTNRSIAFNGLEPGNYLLEVKAVNPDLYFEDAYIKLNINILGPWWKSWWAYLCYACIMLCTLYMIYRSRLKSRMRSFESARLKEIDNLKSRFYVNFTHELRTPLSVIIGEAQLLKESVKNEIKSKGTVIYKNGHQLLDLINQILDLSKLESGKLSVDLQHGDVIPLLRYLKDSFQSLGDKKSIRMHFLTSLHTLFMDHDVEKIKRIMSNLLSNAIKYTPEGGDIYIQLEKEKNHANISVKDTGSGMSKEDLPLIFDRYFQSEENKGGTGVGLSLTKELVHLLDGTIQVESEVGKGSIFKLSVPIRKKESTPLVEHDISDVRNNDMSSSIAHKGANEIWQDIDLPLVQIVEDHEDVRNFLVTVLKKDYRIIESKEGSQGFETALEHIPDLIISDIMMPGIDGFELCKKLKTHELTNHIPVILLTSKTDLSSKLEGLELGADAYLNKPFETKEIRIRIKKLLELRSNLQLRYQDSSNTSHTDEVLDEFLLKAKATIDQNLSNSNFGITGLCRELGISRTHLHRKLKALTGQSTSIFIRTIRLQKAHQLLKEGKLNVSEVAYEVGFSDPSYFSRLYSDSYGVAPNVTIK